MRAQHSPGAEHDLDRPDGSTLRVWRTERAGTDVLISPGLGTVPEAWPSLLAADSGLRVHTWYHRGTFGSARPADESRIRLADHVADAVAVLDDAGVQRCAVVGWSMGVAVAVELARTHPERVSSLLLVAGVPGPSLEAVLGISRLPSPVRPAAVRAWMSTMQLAAPVLAGVLNRVPVNPATMWLLRHSGFIRPSADPEAMINAVRRFFQHEGSWYVRLALGLGREPRPDLSVVRCPVTVLAGHHDMISGLRDTTAGLGAVPQTRLRVLPTSHFIPLEAGDQVLEELRLLLARAAGVDEAVAAARALTTGSRRGA